MVGNVKMFKIYRHKKSMHLSFLVVASLFLLGSILEKLKEIVIYSAINTKMFFKYVMDMKVYSGKV